MLSKCLLALASVCSVALGQTEPIRGFPQVEIPSGMQIVGQTNQFAHSFYSIPYAQPPVGDLRFMPPVPLERRELFNASTPGYIACWQPDVEWIRGRQLNRTEDCLVLSVHAPSASQLASDDGDSLLPVLFWIHGGAFFAGAGTEQLYESRYLSNRTNTVVVTVNYRLGALGYLAYEEDGVILEGNQGHKDQQLALKWVNDNIRSFGGDPNKVTIFGESAGAQSVSFHLLSSISEPYFQRAIVLSNPGDFTYPTPKESETVAYGLALLLGCDGSSVIECLRSKTAEEISAQHNSLVFWALERGDVLGSIEPFRPTIDGREFLDQPMALFRAGAWNTDKEVVVGATADELATDPAARAVVDAASFVNTTIEQMGPDNGPRIAEEYLRSVEGNENIDYQELFANVLTDVSFVCPSILLSRFITKTSTRASPSSFLYIYDHPETSAPECSDPGTNGTCGVATHGAELSYLFETGQLLGYDLKEKDAIVTKQLQDYWGSFAYNGQPTSPSFTTWPEYKPNESGKDWPSIRIQSPNSRVDLDYRNDYCEFLNSLDLYVKNDDLEDLSYLEQLCRKVSMAFAFLVI